MLKLSLGKEGILNADQFCQLDLEPVPMPLWQIHLGDSPDLGDLGCEIGLCKILESGSESERLLIIHSFPLCDSTYVFNNPFSG